MNPPIVSPFQVIAKETGAPEPELTTNIALPSRLWRGRYLMLRIRNLWDDEEDKKAFRPCAVWKAFADQETGELVGLELYPVKRTLVAWFTHKLPVHPIATQSLRQSYLIANCLVRVPLSDRYFYDEASTHFYELPPDKILGFQRKIDHMAMTGTEPYLYGLKKVPDNWVETDLDTMPDGRQLDKMLDRGTIRFDHFRSVNRPKAPHPA